MRALRVGISTFIFALVGVAALYTVRSHTAAVEQPQVLAATVETVDATELSILARINKIRVESGAKELSYSSAMKNLTTDRVSDMATRHYYSHKSPDGYTFGHTIHDYDSTSVNSCENLQLQVGDDWQEAIDAWVDSPAHYRCLTSPDLTSGAGSVLAYDEVTLEESNTSKQMYVFAFIATN